MDSAAAAGVDRTTLHRWLRDDPVFIAEYQTDRAEMVGGIRRALAALGQAAVTSLREILTAETPADIRLRATLALLKMLGADCPDKCSATSAREASIAIRQRAGGHQDERAHRIPDRVEPNASPAAVTRDATMNDHAM